VKGPEFNYESSLQASTTAALSPPDSQIWKPSWDWLPNFVGTNGPILRLTGGSDGALFIVGAFNNLPPVLMWMNTTNGASSIINLQGKSATLQGFISAVAVANMRTVYIPPPTPMPTPPKGYSMRVVIGSVIVGACVLAIIGIVYKSPFGYSAVPGDEQGNNDDTAPGMLIPLGTLDSGSGVGFRVDGVDFKQCYEHAMRARELPVLGNSLLMINPNEVVLARVIGEGSFGRVWSGHWRNDHVAVKEFVFAQAAVVGGSVEKYRLIQEIVGEAGIMSYMHHPKILLLYGCCLTVQAIWIVTELCTHGSLRMVLENKSIVLSNLQKLSFCLDIADAMMYMHSRSPPILHRDLKSHNIFVTAQQDKLVAKVGDWGSAKALALSATKSMTHGVGTACWIAPEVITNTRFSKESDVYAYAIVLWEVYTRKEVYERLSAAQIISKVAYEQLRPPIPLNCPWNKLMIACWSQNAEDRPSFARVLSSLSELYADVKKNGRNMKGSVDQLLLSSSTTPSSFPPASAMRLNHNFPPPSPGQGSSAMMSASYGATTAISDRSPEKSKLFQGNTVSSSSPVKAKEAVITQPISSPPTRPQKTLGGKASPQRDSENNSAERQGYDSKTSSLRGRVNSDPLISDLERMRESGKIREEAGCRPSGSQLISTSPGGNYTTGQRSPSTSSSARYPAMSPLREPTSLRTSSRGSSDSLASEDRLQYSPITPVSLDYQVVRTPHILASSSTDTKNSEDRQQLSICVSAESSPFEGFQGRWNAPGSAQRDKSDSSDIDGEGSENFGDEGGYDTT
jgi:hypothetical protein